jgi:hypothetical protein
MNSTVEELTIALWKVENQISKLTDKYLSTNLAAKTFMTNQTPLLMQRSVLIAKIKVLSVPSPDVPDAEQPHSSATV